MLLLIFLDLLPGLSDSDLIQKLIVNSLILADQFDLNPILLGFFLAGKEFGVPNHHHLEYRDIELACRAIDIVEMEEVNQLLFGSDLF
jgi:hypothetical protein